MRSGEASSSQIDEVLAITQLKSAALEESTLTYANLQLIGFDQTRINCSKGHNLHEVSFASV